MVVQQARQPRPKLQPVTAAIAAVPLAVTWQEEVQLLAYDAVRLLVARGWVATGCLYELGVTLAWAEVRLLARLGGGEERPNRPPGKLVLTRGLRRLLDHLATEAILADEVRQHGSLPPRIAALLGRSMTG